MHHSSRAVKYARCGPVKRKSTVLRSVNSSPYEVAPNGVDNGSPLDPIVSTCLAPAAEKLQVFAPLPLIVASASARDGARVAKAVILLRVGEN
jgi:hypothetical protein